jgi:hypothetical protein
MKFKIGDLLHNRQTNEDGRVTELRSGGYEVAIPMDPTSWMLGSSVAEWPESIVEISTNQSLKQPRA